MAKSGSHLNLGQTSLTTGESLKFGANFLYYWTYRSASKSVGQIIIDVFSPKTNEVKLAILK